MDIQVTTEINGINYKDAVKKQIAAIRKGLQPNPIIRNRVLTLMSNFIAETGPFKTVVDKTSYDQPLAAPDMLTTISDFNKAFSLQEFKLQGSVSDTEIATIDLKQTTSEQRLLGLTSITLSGENQKSFESMYGLEQTIGSRGKPSYKKTISINDMTSEQIRAYLKSNSSLAATMFKRVEQKFSNMLYVDYLDKRHDNKPSIHILADMLTAIGVTDIFSDKLELVPRIKSRTNDATIEINIKLTAAAETLMLEKATDITVRFHKALGATIAREFPRYVADKIAGSKSFTELLTYAIALANEFAEGSHTPIEYLSQVKSSKGSVTQSIKIKNDQAKKQSIKRQTFISNIQWTMLTQKRLGETMKRIGNPEPPDIKERSGRFRASVEVSANYRANLLSYTYNPLYRGLEHYGYHPEVQVERAIREVAQQLYSRHFSINRKGSLA